MQNRRWQDYVALIASIWLIISPWALGHTGDANRVFYNAVVVGLVIAGCSIADMSMGEERWPSHSECTTRCRRSRCRRPRSETQSDHHRDPWRSMELSN